ncbi:uncharacterized protein LOC141611510 [Silene latifolia]|uniref:uncharacterized protein LOC141611510 n=1 Tax=Silene latifolia TaxID=37657 RepID=UPI003D78528A
MDYMMDMGFDPEKAGKKGCFGTYLFEVFNVRINQKIEVYGTFTVEDEYGTLDFYNKLPMDCHSVQPNSSLLSLTQPPRLIPAAGTITLSLDLKDKYGNEFVKGSFTLDLTDETNIDIFNKYRMARIDGNVGSAFVYYTLPLVSLRSKIQIQLIKGDEGIGHSDVEGKIVARYGNDYDNCDDDDEVKPYSWFTLYETTANDISLQLKDKDLHPLSRSFVVVPARCFIIIEMDLKFHHSDGHTDYLKGYQIETLACGYNGLFRDIKLNNATLKASITFSAEEPFSW